MVGSEHGNNKDGDSDNRYGGETLPQCRYELDAVMLGAYQIGGRMFNTPSYWKLGCQSR